MMKFLLSLVAAGMGFVILRMLLVKAGLAKPSGKDAAKGAKMSQLRKELDMLLWVPPRCWCWARSCARHDVDALGQSPVRG